MHTSALVLFSGGQDSTTCLAYALQRYTRVETIGFAYGQRHAVEMDVRPTVLAELRQSEEGLSARDLGDLLELNRAQQKALTSLLNWLETS